MKVKEIIDDFVIKIGDYPTVTEEQTLGEAVAVIQANKSKENGEFLTFSALLVLDKRQQIVGSLDI